MKRTLTIIGLGLAGMALAVGVSVAAFALVGGSLSNPASGIKVPVTTPSETTSKSPSRPSRARPKTTRTTRPRALRRNNHRPHRARPPVETTMVAVTAAVGAGASPATTTAEAAEDTARTTDLHPGRSRRRETVPRRTWQSTRS